jgi:hypothetical protein
MEERVPPRTVERSSSEEVIVLSEAELYPCSEEHLPAKREEAQSLLLVVILKRKLGAI